MITNPILSGAALILFTLLLLMFIRKWAEKKEKPLFQKKNFSLTKPEKNELIEFMAIVVTYLLLLALTREIFPGPWEWACQKGDLFWIIQGFIVSFILTIRFVPKEFLLPLLYMFTLTTLTVLGAESVRDEVGMTEMIPIKEITEVPELIPATEEETRDFLKGMNPPKDLKERKENGEIWSLKRIFADKVDSVEWSRVIGVPTPINKNHLYVLRIKVLSGQIDIKNRGEYVGKYPSDDFKIRTNKPVHLEIKSTQPETAVTIWLWTEEKHSENIH